MNRLKRLSGKKVRSFKRFLKVLSAFSGIILTGLVVVFLLKADFFQIKNIKCIKNGSSCNKQEENFLNEFIGKNIFTFKNAKEAEEVEDNFYKLSKVKIEKKLPQTLLVELYPRESAVAFSVSGKTWYLIDKDAVIFDQQIEKPKDLPAFNINNDLDIKIGKKLEKDWVKIVDLADSLQNGYVNVEKIELEYPSVKLILSEGSMVYMSLESDISRQVGSLQFILRQSKIEGRSIKAIDLRFDKPTIKYEQ